MKDKIHIYYWSPFISNVATVNAVLGSIRTLKLILIKSMCLTL